MKLSIAIGYLAALIQLAAFTTAPAWAGEDALLSPAVQTSRAQHSLLLDVARAGDRLVAVGERGFVLFSDDKGTSWSQVQVPVRVTLTAVYFADALNGWAVGHDGVVLSTLDGGETWNKLLDGLLINEIAAQGAQHALAEFEQRLGPVDQDLRERLEIQFDDAQAFAQEGPSRPLLDLWFSNDREGWVVGAFGLILHTVDGGQSWISVAHRLPNPDGFHYNSINRIAGALFIAGEAGTLYRSLDDGDTWQRLNLPYEGSLFGVLGREGATEVVAFGLRGNAFLSNDLGEHWQAIDTGISTTLAGGTVLANGSLVMVGYSGAVVFRSADGGSFRGYLRKDRLPYSAVVGSDGNSAIVVGFGGARTIVVDETGAADLKPAQASADAPLQEN